MDYKRVYGSHPFLKEWLESNQDPSAKRPQLSKSPKKVSAHWFRHGLRLHDNPALLKSLENCSKFIPIFIFDGESAGMKGAGYNRVKYLCESLEDINRLLKATGGELIICQGSPCEIFEMLHKKMGLGRITFEQDCEAIWNNRDTAVKKMCSELNIEMVECISHTLWDPFRIIKANGGHPPLSYEMFLQVSSTLGLPPLPEPEPDFSQVEFAEIPEELADKLKVFVEVPTPEDMGFEALKGECPIYVGGETIALEHLTERLKVEEEAFKDGIILPNQVTPDLIGPPMSMSAALRFGCLSVRKFYWEVQNVYYRIYRGEPPPTYSLTAQLIWREFFYCMSANNPKYDCMKSNPICIQIPWYDDNKKLEAWEDGVTGYPFIDACMRQLKKEGWIHHACRTAVACFLTRGDLWISWEKGLEVFQRYLIDADWSVCAGNWMWVSSSAFDRQLDCSTCICPVKYGKRVDPTGEYIRRYVPELSGFPEELLFKPWKASMSVQEAAGCVIGKDYPDRIVVHKVASKENRKMMREIRDKLRQKPDHCCPSNPQEISQFLNLPESCFHNIDF